MANQRSTSTRYALLVMLAVGLTTLGCNVSFEMDPATTVTVEISGITGDENHEQVQEALKEMTDGSSHTMSYTSWGDSMTVQLSPVSDVDAFASGIDFGTVTEVDGRTVKVDYAQ